MESKISLIACCIILSLVDGIPNGWSLPLSLGLNTHKEGLNWNERSFIFAIILMAHSVEKPSSISLSVPIVPFPGLDFIFKYAALYVSITNNCL